ncbi:MAG TPA: tyrosine-type recombinase/integrase [Thermotogota bacterium]|nr:tyrosine-type recombinase/integrase [Saccharofermentans sp.]HPR97435.1 tyrosine-type recombinase/integrase [Thermotogota bacterium]
MLQTTQPTTIDTAPVRDLQTVRPDFTALMEEFLAYQDVAESSKRTYKAKIKQFFLWLGDNPPESGQVEKKDILEYKEQLLSEGKAANTVTGYLIVVRKFFAWMAAEKGLKDPTTGIKGVKRSNSFRKDALSVDQIKHLLNTIDRSTITGLRDFAMINLMIRTGLRTIELSRANEEDIRQESGEAVLYIQGKGHFEKDAYVKLNASTLKPLMAYLRARGTVKGSDPLFISHSNRAINGRLTTRSIRHVTKQHMGDADIYSSRITTHSLRHSAVTLVLLAGGSIQEAQTLARHKSVDTTMIYAHNIDRIKNAPENKIDSLLGDG